MKTMTALGYKTGDKFIYNAEHAGSTAWFVDGSIITLTQPDEDGDTNTPRFDGPAKEDNVGGNRQRRGEITKGYAKLVCVTPLHLAAGGVTFTTAEVRAITTTITVARSLTPEERDQILAIVAGEK